MKPKSQFDILAGFAMVSQFGIGLVLPPVLLTLLAVWLNNRYQMGLWFPVAALVIGLTTGICSAIRTARVWLYRHRDADQPPTITKETPHED